MRKRKNYIVIITTKKTEVKVNTLATSKREAIDMVKDVLTKCDLFGFKSLDSFSFECYREKKGGLK